MSKYTPLWEHIQKDSRLSFKLTYAEIEEIAGVPIDHSFLNFKKELLAYGYQVGKISMQEQTVAFSKLEDYKIRAMQEPDYACLREFIYQAIFIPTGAEPPPRSIINDQQIFAYIKDFGTQEGDLGVACEQNGQVIGAAWTRIISGYGHVDNETPELAISILPEFRGYGIGTKLMHRLFKVLRENGYTQTSLSVQRTNPAARFYKRLGYKVISENDDDCIMVKTLSESVED